MEVAEVSAKSGRAVLITFSRGLINLLDSALKHIRKTHTSCSAALVVWFPIIESSKKQPRAVIFYTFSVQNTNIYALIVS